MREENFLGLRADLQVGGRGFGKFSEAFSEFFWNFSTIFLEFSAIFWKISIIFWKISPKFLQFFSTFAISLRFFRKFLPTIRYGSTGVSPYCKFTSKFTLILILILIKILQSTKFEGSHFHNLLQLLIDFHNLFKPCVHFPNLFPSLRSFPFAAVFSRPQLHCSKGTNGRPSPCDVGGMWAIRGIISRITSLIVSRLTSQRPGRKPTKNRGKTEAPFAFPFPQPPPHSTKFQILISQIISILVSRPTPPLVSPPPFPPLIFSEKISKYL